MAFLLVNALVDYYPINIKNNFILAKYVHFAKAQHRNQ